MTLFIGLFLSMLALGAAGGLWMVWVGLVERDWPCLIHGTVVLGTLIAVLTA